LKITTVTTTDSGLSEKCKTTYLRRQGYENLKKKNSVRQISTDASFDWTIL